MNYFLFSAIWNIHSTRASMRTIYFVWKVTFRLIINQNRLYCFAVCCLILFPIHSLTNRRYSSRLLLRWNAFDWMVALVKSQRKAVSHSLRVCMWERFAGLYRWNVWFSSSVSGESGWNLKWNQSATVCSQYYRVEKAQSLQKLRVQLDQIQNCSSLSKDVMVICIRQ